MILLPHGEGFQVFSVVATPCFIFVARRRVHRRDMTARALESPVLKLQAGNRVCASRNGFLDHPVNPSDPAALLPANAASNQHDMPAHFVKDFRNV